MRKRGRTRLTFQKPLPGNDGFGSFPTAGGWGEDIDIGVNLRPLRGNEAEQNGAVQGRQSYECEIRIHYIENSPGIDKTWRAVDAARNVTFNISSISRSDEDFRFYKVVITDGEPN